ncbi:MAG: hypothetical protein IPK03_06345 [Bacteroidetes bacterium]|nr:hypothetical protein [Bacteroidota bacterium]
MLDKTNEDKRKNRIEYLKGLCLIELSNNELANNLLNKAMQKAIQLKDTNLVNECNLGLAKVDYSLKKYDSSLAKYKLAQIFYEQNKLSAPLAMIHEGKAKVYVAQNNLGEALKESNRAYAYAGATSYDLNLQEITSLLSTIYYRLGDKDKAYKYLQELGRIKDSLFAQDVSEKVSMTNSNVEFEQRERVLKRRWSAMNGGEMLRLHLSPYWQYLFFLDCSPIIH